MYRNRPGAPRQSRVNCVNNIYFMFAELNSHVYLLWMCELRLLGNRHFTIHHLETMPPFAIPSIQDAEQ